MNKTDTTAETKNESTIEKLLKVVQEERKAKSLTPIVEKNRKDNGDEISEWETVAKTPKGSAKLKLITRLTEGLVQKSYSLLVTIDKETFTFNGKPAREAYKIFTKDYSVRRQGRVALDTSLGEKAIANLF